MSPARSAPLWELFVGDSGRVEVSGSEQRVDPLTQLRLAEGADVGLDSAVVVQERERRLSEYVVRSPQGAVVVDGMVESFYRQRLDEILDGTEVASTGDSDE